ncbi:beta-lactamase family protein [Selenomonas sp. FOBRC6]|uniref:MBL fold metallo-hydrolase n=1 Tax=Selenomonas sp. FOBRC6 TaxID=936572 RepID=UPI0002781591|nr:MBL fold metallo-hydrolase [Selenomonas sp. FOBRC6]EJO23013.1 beta-lactamase family protein [Selenomonas sp. FOBRC6]
MQTIYRKKEYDVRKKGGCSLQVSILASGSKGNSVYVELDGARILIDAGISAARITKGLRARGVEPQSLDAVLVTHEHIDHVRGLRTLAKQYHVPILATQGTLAGIDGGASFAEDMHRISEDFTVGAVTVRPFPISHDAAEPCGFRLEGSHCCALATDLGVVTETVQDAMEGADVLVLEANHDADLLRQGSYPWPLKRRILSNRGHLANGDAAWALTRMKKPPRKVYLAHLSEENNRPTLARDTVNDILASRGITLDIESCLPEGGAEIIM